MNLYNLPDDEAIPLILWSRPEADKPSSEIMQRAEDLSSEAGIKIMGRLAKAGLLKPGDDPVALIDRMIGEFLLGFK
jgi:hypothetical protein